MPSGSPVIPSLLQYDVFRVAGSLMTLGSLGFFFAALAPGRRRGPAFAPFLVFAASTIGYLVANTMEICSVSAGESLFWSRLIYVFIGYMPMVWLEFSLRFTREGRGMPAWLFALIGLFPLATMIVVFSRDLMHLVWTSMQWFREGPFLMSVRTHGPWFVSYATYTYVFLFAGVAVLVRAFMLHHSFYRRQVRSIFLGFAIPVAASMVFVFRPFPGLTKEFTALGYAAAGAFFYVALFRRDLFALAPVARSLVLERMQDGVLVLDKGGRIADGNAAALAMFDGGEAVIGERFRAAEPEVERLLAAADTGEVTEFSRSVEGSLRHYSTLSMRLGDRGEGVVVVVRDITEAKNLLARVESLASTDELTGLPNRRCFMVEAERELAMARRHGTSLSVAMFDIDRFKSINDCHGHAAGDVALKAFGSILAAEVRKDDVAGRIGGEEFALLLWSAELQDAWSICERIRSKIESRCFEDADGCAIRMTVSAGLAAFGPEDADLDTLLARADCALYEAKSAGRNRVVARRPVGEGSKERESD